MRRQIAWTERAEDGIKVDIRVTLHGGTVKWQFKRHDADGWDYDLAPTPQQWDDLEVRLRNRYQRGQIGLTKDLENIRRQRS